MKHLITSFLITGLLFTYGSVKSQDVYSTSGGELIFSWPEVSLNSGTADRAVRFTAFFHVGQFWNIDLNNNLGFYSGASIINIGMITNETLNNTDEYKIIRRVYTLGIPLALKLGSFKDNFFLFGGGEYEMAFHYKEKYWSNTFSRNGHKTKYTSWFGDQTPRFLPSVYAGIQFPKGIRLKFKYYLTDFLNNKYTNSNEVSDLTRYTKSQLFYFSLSWHLKSRRVKQKIARNTTVARL